MHERIFTDSTDTLIDSLYERQKLDRENERTRNEAHRQLTLLAEEVLLREDMGTHIAYDQGFVMPVTLSSGDRRRLILRRNIYAPGDPVKFELAFIDEDPSGELREEPLFHFQETFMGMSRNEATNWRGEEMDTSQILQATDIVRRMHREKLAREAQRLSSPTTI